MEKQYMQVQLRQAGTPTPEVIGVDAASIRNGHSYRIVVSDLISRRQLWLGALDEVRKSEYDSLVGRHQCAAEAWNGANDALAK